jgi:hypothetical protein
VPNGSTLQVTGYSLNDGNGGANYAVSLQTAPGTITPAGLTIAASSDSKVDDGTTASSAVPTVLGLVGGDTATSLAQAFQSPNVLGLNGSTLDVTGYSLNDGNNGGNYTVSLLTAAGTINPAPTQPVSSRDIAVIAAISSQPPPPPPPPNNSDPANSEPGSNPPAPPETTVSDSTASALNDIAPTAGDPDSSSTGNSQSGPGNDTQTDSATSALFQSLGGPSGQNSGGNRNSQQTNSGSTTRTIINGVLVEAPPPPPPGDDSTVAGVPPADQEFSSWGNEAYWQ